MRRVVVVGAGVAGTAAAIAAASTGALVTMISGGTGASVVAGGAIDDVAWDGVAHEAAPVDARTQSVLDALDAYSVRARHALVVATTGLVRPARGVDRALLDLGAIDPGTFLVADVSHGAWDAETLARVWSASPRAKVAGHRFVAVRASLLARTDELAFPDADIAQRHDDPARLVWLGDRLREACASFGRKIAGIVVPPWLGVAQERATALSSHVGVPCGEALGGVGGPSGLRFEHARDRALAKAGVRVAVGRASSVRPAEGDRAWRVTYASHDSHDSHDPQVALECDAVVLATGGIIGGGLEYTPAGAYLANALPESPRPLLRATCDAPLRLGARGRPLDDPSSLFGSSPESHTWPVVADPLLDHAGVLVHQGGEVKGAPPGLYATGELAAGPPHTWLAALAHGARAGEAARS